VVSHLPDMVERFSRLRPILVGGGYLTDGSQSICGKQRGASSMGSSKVQSRYPALPLRRASTGTLN
jgi:hypothetical protein